MKKLVSLFLLTFIIFTSAFAQVDEMVHDLGSVLERDLIMELDGVVQKNEVITLDDGSTSLQIASSFDYVSAYSFRSRINSLVEGFNDVHFLDHWKRDGDAITCTLVVAEEDSKEVYPILVSYYEEDEVSIIHIWKHNNEQ